MCHKELLSSSNNCCDGLFSKTEYNESSFPIFASFSFGLTFMRYSRGEALFLLSEMFQGMEYFSSIEDVKNSDVMHIRIH